MEKRAIDICETLQKAGFEAYFAGGAVRDMLMGHEPCDFDIVTDATPNEIEIIFKKNKFIPVGREFGIMIMIHKGHQFEVATFRSDSDDTDGRRPNAVFYTNAERDAERRDFTINGIFYDPVEMEYLDYVGGRADISARYLRFIGEPEKRINEDYLRMLRAVRFKNKFELEYDPAAKEAISKLAFKIIDISHERIRDELNKMLSLPQREQCMRDLFELGLMEQVLLEVWELAGVKQSQKMAREGDAFEHTMKMLGECSLDEPLAIVWTCLLHDIGKDDTIVKKPKDVVAFPAHATVGAEESDKVMRRLKFPNVMRVKIEWVIRHHMSFDQIVGAPVATRRKYFMHDEFEGLLRVGELDARAHYPQDLKHYKKLADLYEADKTILLPGMEKLLTGRDIIDELGVESGPEIAELLEKAWVAQLEEKVKTKKEALKFLKK